MRSDLQLVDFDQVEWTNVTTQGYLVDDVGHPKVAATGTAVREIEPTIELDLVNDRYRPKLQIGEAVFCCVDSISARAAIWRSASSACRFWCDGRMLGEIIRVLTVADRRWAACIIPTTLFQPVRSSGRPLHGTEHDLHRRDRCWPDAPSIRPLAAASGHRSRPVAQPPGQRTRSGVIHRCILRGGLYSRPRPLACGSFSPVLRALPRDHFDNTGFLMLTPREAANILAALLYWQEEMCPHAAAVTRPYFETLDLADFEPLSASEIDKLSLKVRSLFLPNR